MAPSKSIHRQAPKNSERGEKEHYLDPGTRRVNLKQSALRVPGEAPEPAPSSQALLSFMLREDAHPPDASWLHLLLTAGDRPQLA